MIVQIFEEIQIRMMPKQDKHRLIHLLDALAHQIHYILKISTE